mgnify:CR=1 FL=1
MINAQQKIHTLSRALCLVCGTVVKSEGGYLKHYDVEGRPLTDHSHYPRPGEGHVEILTKGAEIGPDDLQAKLKEAMDLFMSQFKEDCYKIKEVNQPVGVPVGVPMDLFNAPALRPRVEPLAEYPHNIEYEVAPIDGGQIGYAALNDVPFGDEEEADEDLNYYVDNGDNNF